MQAWLLEVDGSAHSLYVNLEALLDARTDVEWTKITPEVCEGNFQHTLHYHATPWTIHGAE